MPPLDCDHDGCDCGEEELAVVCICACGSTSYELIQFSGESYHRASCAACGGWFRIQLIDPPRLKDEEIN